MKPSTKYDTKKYKIHSFMPAKLGGSTPSICSIPTHILNKKIYRFIP